MDRLNSPGHFSDQEGFKVGRYPKRCEVCCFRWAESEFGGDVAIWEHLAKHVSGVCTGGIRVMRVHAFQWPYHFWREYITRCHCLTDGRLSSRSRSRLIVGLPSRWTSRSTRFNAVSAHSGLCFHGLFKVGVFCSTSMAHDRSFSHVANVKRLVT